MTIARWFFIILASAIALLFWQIVSPFVLSLITAAVMAIVIEPLYEKLERKVRHPHLAAFVMTVAVFLIIFIPLILIAILMLDQVSQLLQQSLTHQIWPTTTELMSRPIVQHLPTFIRDRLLAFDLPTTIETGTTWIANNIGVVLQNIVSFSAHFALSTIIFFLALFYFLVDREKIVKELLVLSPLKDKDDHKIMHRVIQTVRAVVFGSLVMSIVQGVIATIGMAIFGVPGFLIWGALSVVAAQVPMIGICIITIPAALLLILSGATVSGLGLIIWTVILVLVANNLLSPQLIQGKTHMHAFLILLAILGGLQLFGPIGIVVGPTVLAAFLVVIELYKSGILDK